MSKYNITSRIIQFDILDCFNDRFVHCYTRGIDNDLKSFDFTAHTDCDDEVRRFKNNVNQLSRDVRFNPDKLITVRQMHTDRILNVTQESINTYSLQKERNVYDAMITNEKGVTLATRHADCVPVYFVDPVLNVIGLSHSGWKGTLSLIAPKTVLKMRNDYNCELKNIRCVIGPSISECCYEIKKDVYSLFVEKLPFSIKSISSYQSKYYMDLKAIIYTSLIHTNLQPEYIYTCDLCTSCNDHILYSHRASRGCCGRSLAILGIR